MDLEAETPNETIGERLRRLRTSLRLTQRELAEPAYTSSFVSLVEAGKKRPSDDALQHFAKKLGVSVEQLAEGGAHDLRIRLQHRLQEARKKGSAGKLEEAVADYHQIRDEAQSLHLVRIEARALEGLGLCSERLLDTEAAIHRFDEAIALLDRESPAARAEAIAGKARCMHIQGDTRYAIYLLESAIGRLEDEGPPDPSALVRLHGTLVHAYRTAGMERQSARSAQTALSLAPQVKDPIRLAAMYVNAASSLLQQGAPKDAEDALLRARDLYTQADLRTEMGRAHGALGILQAAEGEVESGIRELETALEIFELTQSRRDIAGALTELGRIRRENGDIAQARPLLERAMSVLLEADIIDTALAHRELGLCDVGSDPLNAEKHLRLAADLYMQADAPRHAAKVRRLLGDLFTERGRVREAAKEYRAAALLVEESFPTV